MKEERIIENPKIYAAIAGVIADCGIVGKDKVNKQQGFKYRSVDDVFNALHPALAKNKVVIIPTVVERQCEEVGKTKNGTAILKVICKVKYDICAEDGSRVTSIIYGEGMDMGDKATNKAMAIAYKYLCFQVFCIPTEEMSDPDGESLEEKIRTPKKQLEKKQEKPKEQPATTESSNDEAEDVKISQPMLATIQNEQKRTGVTDKQILAMRDVKAKKIEDMTVLEYKKVMSKFQKTPDLQREAEQDE
ncbi:ERF family protein [Dorea ammoniilytica]|uniref:ERF family protein n=1 Tax=Dorea ammoniilytica TaxID=2981788 RepID=A0ABT2S7X1_9FIRM|nr:ERF family protein [Dorea ammoniilytica]MCU6700683.1 ERF family protein [Dorea ammoniilytica]SCH98988.1 ERF superfamily [uncultured Eubacterium sp.]